MYSFTEKKNVESSNEKYEKRQWHSCNPEEIQITVGMYIFIHFYIALYLNEKAYINRKIIFPGLHWHSQ